MSTTYYVRTVDTSFPSLVSGTYDSKWVLWYNSSSDLRLSEYLFNTSLGGTYAYLRYNNTYPMGTSVAGSRYVLTSLNAITNILDTNWTSWGFHPSNITTFKNELCSNFNAWKNITTGGVNWGTDNGEVNMYLIRFTVIDTGNTYSVPIFYMGNDPQADETIVI